MEPARKVESFRIGPQAAPAAPAPLVRRDPAERQQVVRCRACGGAGWFGDGPSHDGGGYTSGETCRDCDGEGEVALCLGCYEVAGSADCSCTICPEDGQVIPFEGVCPEAELHGK